MWVRGTVRRQNVLVNVPVPDGRDGLPDAPHDCVVETVETCSSL